MSGSMKVWGKWLQRTARCRECGQTMQQKEAAVIGSYESANGYFIKSTWHPQCWVRQLMNWLEEHPWQPKHHGGRRSLGLSKADRRRRLALLRQFSRLRAQRVEAVAMDWMYKLPELDQAAHSIMQEMELVGGAPAAWTRR